MLIVRQLDALNRFCFRKDAESLAGVEECQGCCLAGAGEERQGIGDPA